MQTGKKSQAVKLSGRKPRILVIEARYYTDISDFLLEGTQAALKKAGAIVDKVTVPGALEIPAVVAMAHKSGATYDGYVALGCVIRGETTHYEIVSEQSCRGLMDLAIGYGLAIGNGILTVENKKQALARAKKNEHDRGGAAVAACLSLIAAKRRLS